MIKVGKKFNVRDVVREDRKAEVQEWIKLQYEANPGEQEFIKHIQEGITAVMKGLTDEEVEEYQEMADDWNTREAPPEQKAK